MLASRMFSVILFLYLFIYFLIFAPAVVLIFAGDGLSMDSQVSLEPSSCLRHGTPSSHQAALLAAVPGIQSCVALLEASMGHQNTCFVLPPRQLAFFPLLQLVFTPNTCPAATVNPSTPGCSTGCRPKSKTNKPIHSCSDLLWIHLGYCWRMTMCERNKVQRPHEINVAHNSSSTMTCLPREHRVGLVWHGAPIRSVCKAPHMFLIGERG